MMGMHKFSFFLILVFMSGSCLFSQEPDLTIPEMTDKPAAAGLRVKITAPEYTGTEFHHSLYLPTDWERGKKILSSLSILVIIIPKAASQV